jgi:hypothetical protein
MAVPIALLAGLCFLESRPWRAFCAVVLVLWLGFAVVLPVIYGDWARLFFPALVIVFWLFMAEAKRMFKE